MAVHFYKPTVKLSSLNSTEPFGCCAAHQSCKMGKEACVWEKDDLNYAKLCSVYKRRMRGEVTQAAFIVHKPTFVTPKEKSHKGNKANKAEKIATYVNLEMDLFF